MSTSKKILIIAPHADDEVLGVGGTIAKYKSKYDFGLVVCGERETDDPKIVAKATDYFNYVRIVPHYRDEHYHSNFNGILKEIERAHLHFESNIVYIPNSLDFNNDHRTVHRACEIAFRRYQPLAPEKILMYEIPSSTTQSFENNFKCNYYEPLTKKHVDEKIKMFSVYEQEMREYPNPRSAKGLETYARFRGMECYSNYAEGFNLVYQKNVSD